MRRGSSSSSSSSSDGSDTRYETLYPVSLHSGHGFNRLTGDVPQECDGSHHDGHIHLHHVSTQHSFIHLLIYKGHGQP